MKVIDHATAARCISALMDEARTTGDPITIVDPGRNRAVLMDWQTWEAMRFALNINNEIATNEQNH